VALFLALVVLAAGAYVTSLSVSDRGAPPRIVEAGGTESGRVKRPTATALTDHGSVPSRPSATVEAEPPGIAVRSPAGVSAPVPPRRIAGRVRGPFGAPLPTAVVTARPVGGGRRLRTVADTEGRFVFEGVEPATRYRLRLENVIRLSALDLEAGGMLHDGRTRSQIEAEARWPGDGPAARAGDVELDLSVSMRTGFIGRVVRQADGKPVDRYHLTRAGTRTSIASRVRDPLGRFFIVTQGGAALRLSARASDASSAVQSHTTVAGQIVQGIVLRVSERGVLVGTIRHRHGKRVRLAKVTARHTRTGEILAIRRAETGADGVLTYRLTDLPTGTVRLTVETYDFLPWQNDGVPVVEGQEIRQDVLVEDGGALSIKAIGLDGNPRPGVKVVLQHLQTGAETSVGAFVHANGARFGARAFRTDAQGRFRQPALLPGPSGSPPPPEASGAPGRPAPSPWPCDARARPSRHAARPGAPGLSGARARRVARRGVCPRSERRGERAAGHGGACGGR